MGMVVSALGGRGQGGASEQLAGLQAREVKILCVNHKGFISFLKATGNHRRLKKKTLKEITYMIRFDKMRHHLKSKAIADKV